MNPHYSYLVGTLCVGPLTSRISAHIFKESLKFWSNFVLIRDTSNILTKNTSYSLKNLPPSTITMVSPPSSLANANATATAIAAAKNVPTRPSSPHASPSRVLLLFFLTPLPRLLCHLKQNQKCQVCLFACGEPNMQSPPPPMVFLARHTRRVKWTLGLSVIHCTLILLASIQSLFFPQF